MITAKHNSAVSLHEIAGNIADAELDGVSGGDKKTTTTKPTKPKEYLVVTMNDVLISSYQ